MHFLVSGLVILSIFSTPINTINNNLIQISLSNFKKNKKTKISSEDISNILFDISENFNTINMLKKDKNEIKTKLNDRMAYLAKNKQTLNEQQMAIFQTSNKLIEENEAKINYYTEKIKDRKELTLLQNDVLASNSNFQNIYKKFCLILDYQIQIIKTLYKSIFNLNCCLSAI